MLIDGTNGQAGCGEFCRRCQAGDTAADDENVEDFDRLYDDTERADTGCDEAAPKPLTLVDGCLTLLIY
jgi:hypothetical protein